MLTFADASIVNESAISTTFTTTTRVIVAIHDALLWLLNSILRTLRCMKSSGRHEVNTAQFNMPTSGEG